MGVTDLYWQLPDAERIAHEVGRIARLFGLPRYDYPSMTPGERSAYIRGWESEDEAMDNAKQRTVTNS